MKHANAAVVGETGDVGTCCWCLFRLELDFSAADFGMRKGIPKRREREFVRDRNTPPFESVVVVVDMAVLAMTVVLVELVVAVAVSEVVSEAVAALEEVLSLAMGLVTTGRVDITFDSVCFTSLCSAVLPNLPSFEYERGPAA